MEKPTLLDWVILPLKWLERSQGWKRRGLGLLYLVGFTMACLIGWRELHLLRLPNIREPFDEAKYGTVEVRDSDNALPLYVEANRLVSPPTEEMRNLSSNARSEVDWTKLDPAVRRWVDVNRPAIDAWLKATERPDALVVQPRENQISTIIDSAMSIQNLSRLVMTEASRLLAAGDTAGAWTLIRGVLRSSRHAGSHGGMAQRQIGYNVLRLAGMGVTPWIDHPATTPAQLRQAIADLEACRAMTEPISDVVRIEYFIIKNVLAHPEKWKDWDVNAPEGSGNWYAHVPYLLEARRFLLKEPERSQRVHRLVIAGLLAQCDRPRWARPPIVSGKFSIYEIDARTPPAVASIRPEALVGWAERSRYAVVAAPFPSMVGFLETEPSLFDTWRLRMAQRAYEIEHGQPAKTFADLLGNYLKQLPEGVEPGDAI